MILHKILPRAKIILATVMMLVPQLGFGELNVLIIGSTQDSASSGSIVGDSDPFNPNEIRTQLESILQGAGLGLGTVNVALENRGFPYGLAAWYHYPSPSGVDVEIRWPMLRGELGTKWDHVVLIGDPYTMENLPGLYAQGVAKIAEEIAMGSSNTTNPVETVLLMPWPAAASSSSVAHYQEVVYRTGRSGGYKVAPAALAWEADGSPTNTTRQAYIAAASIFSRIYEASAKQSTHVYDNTVPNHDALADSIHTVVTANIAEPQQYTGKLSFQNSYLMLGDKRRDVHFSEKGTSTEHDYKLAARRAMQRSRVTFNDGAYNDKYDSYTPEDDDRGWPTANPMPIAWNHGRKFSEPNKEYVVNPDYWQLGYGFRYQSNTFSGPIPEANDTHISQIFSQGITLANYMTRTTNLSAGSHPSARHVPWRMIWAQIHREYSDLRPLRDGNGPHVNRVLQEAVGTYMYTLYSGRCSLNPEPSPMTTDWFAKKVGYETAWRLGRAQTRAPGFKVMPSSANAKSITESSTETMSVQFILPPTSDVTVNVSLSNSNAAIIGPQKLVFTPLNYKVPQNVVITGIQGSTASEAFNVVYTTTSDDDVYDGLSDSWAYTINRSTIQALTRSNKGSTQVSLFKNTTEKLNLNTAGANAGNTKFAGPNNGSLAWSGSNVIYTPNPDFDGSDGVAFAVNNGGELSVGSFNIDVINGAPDGIVLYEANGSNGGSVPVDSNIYSINDTVTVLGNTGNLVKIGHSFSGWNTADDGTGTSYNGGASFSIGASGVILYAQWTPNTYTLTYHGNGATSGNVPANQTKTFEVDITLAGNSGNLTLNAEQFIGWNLAANGSGESFAAGATFSLEQAVTLYAQWNTPPTVNAGANQSVNLGSSQAWDPGFLDTAAWYDASDASTIISSGNTVSQWSDKSGNGHSAAQSVAGNQPTTNSNTMGGLNVITFDGSSDFLNLNLDYLAGVSHSAFILTKTTSHSNIYGAANSGNGANSLHVGFRNASNFRMNYWSNDFTPSIGGSLNTAVGNILNFVWKTGTSKEIFANGTSQGSASNAGNIQAMSGGGRLANVTGHGFYGGDIAEIVFLTDDVSEEDRLRMEGYLAHKWGIDASLPDGHKYQDGALIIGATSLSLTGSANDSNGNSMTFSWTKASGPGFVNFTDATTLVTDASFSEEGTYVLRLTADDGISQTSDDVTITVSASTVDNFKISPIVSPQVVGSPITGITITAQDSGNQTVTDFNGTVTFGGTADFTGTSANFVNGLLSGVNLTPTIAGSDLTLTVNDGDSHTGSTTFSIQSIYDHWSDGLNSDADSNHDGVDNGIAWLLGATDPSIPAITLLPIMDNTTDEVYFIYTYRRSDIPHLDPNTTITMQYSTELGSWTDAENSNPNVMITETNDGYDSGIDKVEVKINRILAPDGRLFSRLKLEVSE